VYEPLEIAALQSTLNEQDVVMELGAGLGFLATYASKRIGSERVFTYEANPALEPLIRDTFAVNGVTPTLQLCVLGQSAGERKFFTDDDFRASSTVPSGEHQREIRVAVKRFDDELERIRPTFLIVDIEGGEYDLVQWSSFDGIRKILIEVHENAIGLAGIEAVRSTLARAGFAMDPRLSKGPCWFLSRSDGQSVPKPDTVRATGVP
jgi:FkbM family methyltransferase